MDFAVLIYVVSVTAIAFVRNVCLFGVSIHCGRFATDG